MINSVWARAGITLYWLSVRFYQLSLMAKQISEVEFTTKIISTTDLNTWHDEIALPYQTFARSFEIWNECFYLGMGGFESEENCSWAGDILKVSKKDE